MKLSDYLINDDIDFDSDKLIDTINKLEFEKFNVLVKIDIDINILIFKKQIRH